MSSTTQLVEHFFRHEYGRLVALLTSRLGSTNFQLIEDAVQTALVRALSNWPRHGVPQSPSAWLYRCAMNTLIDGLRQQNMASKKLVSHAEAGLDHITEPQSAIESEVGDETLQLLFLCCHPTIPAESQVALALKTVGGFSTSEIASGLLTTLASVEKRITRAKDRLRESSVEIVELNSDAVSKRLDNVLATIYLLFNEGYVASSGVSNVRQDLCDEALRLCRMLSEHPLCDQPATSALMSLLLMHSARLDQRTDPSGAIILLADQDRTQWNWGRVREAMDWMQRSAQGDELSRYHIEAAIAWEHSRAMRYEDTDWHRIMQLYEILQDRFDSPAVQLNLAIAASYAVDVKCGMQRLLSLGDSARLVLRPWWDCAMAQLLARDQQPQAAISHWRDALALANNAAQKALIQLNIERQF
jgi:RNA polymerase sigma factor (sigma-70 family)